MPVGVYLQDQMKVTQWLELLGGVRYDTFKAQHAYTYTRATGAVVSTGTLLNGTAIAAPTSVPTTVFVSYRAGVVLHPTPNSSIYYMRGTSANPPANSPPSPTANSRSTPVESEVDEIGAKADLLNNKLNVNAALFRIKKKNDYENQGTTAAPFMSRSAPRRWKVSRSAPPASSPTNGASPAATPI